MVLGKAANNNFLRHPRSKTANFAQLGAKAPLTFRVGADRFLFLVTDEDSDCPTWDQNRFMTGTRLQCTGPGYEASDNDRTMEASSSFASNNDFPAGETNAWAKECAETARAIASTKAHLSAFVKPQVGVTIGQWGDPRVQVFVVI